MKNKKSFKSGFAAIIGMPNVGKSTLLNTIVGQKIAIISDKPQTTRNKILAIYSTDEEQIIFTDTPGIHKPHNMLGEYMVHVANESMDDTDVLIFVVDASKKIQETEREIAKNISKTGLPCILVLNKVDLMKKEDLLPIIADYSSMHDFASIVPVSAKNNDGVDILLHDIEDYLEEGPEFYDSDMVRERISPINRLRLKLSAKNFCGCLIRKFRTVLLLKLPKCRKKKKLQIFTRQYTAKKRHIREL